MKQVAGTLRLDLAQYRELAAFAQFGSDLDKATQAQLDRGAAHGRAAQAGRSTLPLAVEQQIVIIFAGTKGYLDDVPVDARARASRRELLEFLDGRAHGRSSRHIAATGRASTKSDARAARRPLKEFKKQFVEENAVAA